MRDTFTVPGGYYPEYDKSFIESAEPDYGSCFIGLTEKGPAFEPLKVNSWSDYIALYGKENSDYYLPYAVKGFLKYNQPATIIRVLGLDTYSITIGGSSGTVYSIISNASIGGAGDAVIYGEIYANSNITPILIGNATESDNFTIGLDANSTHSGLSLNPDLATYFKHALNTEVSSSKDYYAHGGYNWAYSANVALYITQSDKTMPGRYASESNLTKYSNGRTSWIQSQNFGPSTESRITYDLFKVHTIADGNNANDNIKVSIANISATPNVSQSKYGSFDLYVRDFNDTDNEPILLEQWLNLSLDPNATNYIARVIGDQYRTWTPTDGHFSENGNYTRNSKYIYVEMTTDIDNVPQTAVPYGFEAYHTPVYSASLYCRTEPFPTNSVSKLRDYYGINFSKDISDGLQVSMNHDIGSGSTYYVVYDLGTEVSCSIDGSSDKGHADSHLNSGSYAKWRKFTVPFYKGWDALDNNKYKDYSSLYSTLQNAFEEAVDIAGNIEEVDSTDIFIPGISDSVIVTKMINKAEERSDIFYIADTTAKTDTVTTAMSKGDQHDSSFATTYYPWIQIFDAARNKYVYVPPSIGIAKVFAFNDLIGGMWKAPAGFNRGSMDDVIDTYITLNRDDKADLYKHDVNPIAFFKDIGPVVWGQKTLQKKVSKLDRIDVRRMLIRVKKFVRYIALGMVFEQSGPAFWNEFKSKVNPYLEDLKNKEGLHNYNVIMDESNNNDNTEARRQVLGNILLNPQVSGEYFEVAFIIDASGVSFQ